MNAPVPPPPASPIQGSTTSTQTSNSVAAGVPRAGRNPQPARQAAWELDPLHAGEEAGASDFDALTDLFLGEVRTPPGGSTRGIASEAGASRPILRLAREQDLIEEEDEAGTMVPAPSRGAEFAGTARRMSSNPIVECIVLGHLPVMASAWASQYVREIALAAGKPVAFLRAQAGYVTLELVGEMPDGVQPMLTPCATIGEAFSVAGGLTDRWIVRTDMGEEVRLATHPLVRMVTILTAADEAARVGAYSVIKSLAGAIPESGTGDGEGEGPMIRLAVMSAPEAKSEAAAARLAEAVQKFLGRTVQHAMWSPRIRSSRSPVLLYSGPSDLSPTSAMDAIARLSAGGSRSGALAGAESAAGAVTSADAAWGGPIGTDALAESTDSLLERAFLDFDRGADRARSAAGANLEPGRARVPAFVPDVTTSFSPELGAMNSSSSYSSTPASGSTPGPTPALSRAARPPARPAAPSLAPEPTREVEANEEASPLWSHVENLRPVRTRCPYAEGVELAIDRDGAVHLLSRSEPNSGSAGDDATLGQLMVASSWAEAHLALLPTGSVTVRPGRPVLHLFTDQPKRTRRLLETPLRVHLLTNVSVGDRSAWYCTELN